MAQVTRSRDYSTGDVLTDVYYDDDLNEIVAGVNSIDDTQIADGANIAYSKLLLTGGVLNADIADGAGIVYSKLSISDEDIPAAKVTNTAFTLSGEQTVTGIKTFTASTKPAINTASDGSTVTFDLNLANTHVVTLGGNRTLALSNETVGQWFVIELIQGTGGSKIPTWFTTIKWTQNTVPTLTTAEGKKDTFLFRVTGSGTYDGYIVGQNI